jgi:hypothetical protein
LRETLLTAVVTVTARVAVKPPSAVVTVMAALPFATAVTRPVLLTVATPVLFEDHVTTGFVGARGFNTATA